MDFFKKKPLVLPYNTSYTLLSVVGLVRNCPLFFKQFEIIFYNFKSFRMINKLSMGHYVTNRLVKPKLLLTVILGQGDMAVSNTLGSNVFDVLIGLALPWFIKTTMVSPGTIVSIILCG